MKLNAPLLCSHMANAAHDYCNLIDHCCNNINECYWLRPMEKLLPRLHSAVLSLETPTTDSSKYDFPDDDDRCELFMRLNELLINDKLLWTNFDRIETKQRMCDNLADDFTDIYFDLKRGLDLLKQDPAKPHYAMYNWHNSFYAHWGQHLMDAEGWLHALEIRNYNSTSAALRILKTA